MFAGVVLLLGCVFVAIQNIQRCRPAGGQGCDLLLGQRAAPNRRIGQASFQPISCLIDAVAEEHFRHAAKAAAVSEHVRRGGNRQNTSLYCLRYRP